MAFGDKNTKSFGGNKINAFEAAAKSELQEFSPEISVQPKEEPKPKTTETPKTENTSTIKPKATSDKPKTVKKTEKKVATKTKEEIYSLRIEFPKELEPVLKLAGKAHGTMKDYIMELIYNDLEKNIKEYKDQQPVDPDKWKKFL